MSDTPEEQLVHEDMLAQGIAAVMAAEEELTLPEDMADLFLEELNRLWGEPEPLILSN
jgi:hypothetical protein